MRCERRKKHYCEWNQLYLHKPGWRCKWYLLQDIVGILFVGIVIIAPWLVWLKVKSWFKR